MNKFFFLGLTITALAFSACSKNDEQAKTSPTPTNTPDAARLKSESERLQQATSNAAKAREQGATASPAASPTTSP